MITGVSKSPGKIYHTWQKCVHLWKSVFVNLVSKSKAQLTQVEKRLDSSRKHVFPNGDTQTSRFSLCDCLHLKTHALDYSRVSSRPESRMCELSIRVTFVLLEYMENSIENVPQAQEENLQEGDGINNIPVAQEGNQQEGDGINNIPVAQDGNQQEGDGINNIPLAQEGNQQEGDGINNIPVAQEGNQQEGDGINNIPIAQEGNLPEPEGAAANIGQGVVWVGSNVVDPFVPPMEGEFNPPVDHEAQLLEQLEYEAAVQFSSNPHGDEPN
ncbi:uncharacterized protein LOC120354832 isoform X1 [Nilaparvata lugens]|uniref:uncharacterized protein LOC120354832 isoform X1 n=1 Tax=Nilaparvata lugens TaxID=108931 RepID=UPI00193D1B45|nr:uncharacterized protein LOC120354832 isoform X1 [Nilaparvata lugens]